MYSYLTGLLFIIFYVLFMYLIGSAFYKKEGSYPSHFIVGYLIFSFFVAIGGIPIQILNLPWLVFVGYMIIVYVILAVWSIRRLDKANKKIIDTSKIKEFIKNQWFIVFLALLLVIIASTNIEYIWMNNCMDDGYYLGWVSGVPYGINGFHTNPSTGYASSLSDMFSYLLNTTYSEYGFYVFLLNIRTTVFCRIFMAFFDYFLFAMVITKVAEVILNNNDIEIKDDQFQFFSSIIFIFSIISFYYNGNGILKIQDSWQLNTAMYYGSNIVRTCGIFLLTIFYIDKKLDWKMVIGVIGIGIALISKSSIALPVIILVSVSFLLSYLLCEKGKHYRLYGLMIVLGYLLICMIVGNHPHISGAAHVQFFTNLHHYISFWFIVVFFFSAYFLKNKTINKMNTMMIFLLIFMLVNPFDNVFEFTSQFSFVAARMMANYLYSITILSFMYCAVDLTRLCHGIKFKNSIIYILISVLIISLFTSWYQRMDNYKKRIGFGGGTLRFDSTLQVVKDNRYIIPMSTQLLGDVLEQRYQETKHVNVVMMPEGAMVNNEMHSVAIILRTVSPHSISLSATGRYGKDKVGDFQSFSQQDEFNLYDFQAHPTDKTYRKLSKSLNDANVNCLVVNTMNFSSYFERDGFHLYRGIADTANNYNYFVYVRN